MADTKASEEPAGSTPAAADGFAGVQASDDTDVYWTFSKVMLSILALLCDPDSALTGNSDTKIATQKAVKAYVDAHGGGGGGTPHCFNAYASSNTTIAVNAQSKIALATKTIDTDAAFSTSTSLFTASIAGYYAFVGATYSTSGQIQTAIVKNASTTLAYGPLLSGSSAPSVASVASVYLTIGDTVELQAFTPSGATVLAQANGTYLNGTLTTSSNAGVLFAYCAGSGLGDLYGTASWGDLAGYSMSIPANVGDRILVAVNVTPTMVSSSATSRFRLAVNGAPVNDVRYHECSAGASKSATFEFVHVVASGDISAGAVSIQVQWLATTGVYVVNSTAGTDLLVGCASAQNFGGH